MRRLLIPIFALALVCAAAAAAPASAITFGEPDGDLHPNVGVVVIDRSAGSPGPDITCSGTLIAPQVFLTVAHCVDVLESVGKPYWVSFDSAYDEDAAAPTGLIPGTAIKHPLWGSVMAATMSYRWPLPSAARMPLNVCPPVVMAR